MIYVIDTSVFLSDPKVLDRLKDHEVVIPLAVLTELEGKRSHPELGYPARETLRVLEGYRSLYGTLLDPVPTAGNGSLRVELNHVDDSSLPTPLRVPENDNRILAVASNLASEGLEVTLLTKDLPLRLKASVANVEAEDYSPDKLTAENPGEVKTLQITEDELDDFYDGNNLVLDEEILPNQGVILKSPTGSGIGRLKGGKIIPIHTKSIFSISGRSAEQRIAIDLLLDEDVGIVSLGGAAGTGKSILALAAGLESVLERDAHKKVVVFRPLYAVGGQDLGFLPGTAEEKMSPWTAAVFDALETFCGVNVIEQVIEEELLEVLPLTHIRGRTLSDSYVIIDEAQNLEKMILLTALTRIGANSKVVLTHDVAQRDNLRVGRHDGIASVNNALAGSDLFGAIDLVKSERSAVAELVARVIET